MLALKSQPDQRLSQLVVTWVLMIPLFFFACRGILWFQGSEGNSLAGTGFNTLTAAKGSGTVLILAGVFVCVLLILMTRTIPVLRICWNNKVLVALSLYALASCAWSQFPRLSLQFGIYIVLNVLFAFYLHSRFRPESLMKLIALVGWIVVVGSIVFAVAVPKYGVDHRASSAGAWQGIFVYKQPCAIMCTFLLSVAFYMPARKMREKLLRAAYIMLTIFLVIMTQARTGWVLLLGLLFYVVVMNIVCTFKVSDRPAVISVLAMISVVAFVGGALYYREILLLLGKDATLTGRTEIWQLVMVQIMKRPLLGYGYRAFWTGLQGESANLSLAVGWSPTGAHNGFLDVWLNLGLVGLAVVLLIMARGLWDGLICLIHNATPRVKWYVSILLLTILVNMVEYTIMIPNYLTWIMFILASVGLGDEAKKARLQEHA